jgi:hypothetical protein
MAGKRRKGCWIALGLTVIAFGGLSLSGPGQALFDLLRGGVLQGYLMKGGERRYETDRLGNLQAIHTALMLYHDSEGQFPLAEGWMDAIANRLQGGDLTPEEAAKKLVRPELANRPGAHGYALNSAAAGKFKDDVGDPTTVLVFESKSVAKNAQGDPLVDNLESGYVVRINGTAGSP